MRDRTFGIWPIEKVFNAEYLIFCIWSISNHNVICTESILCLPLYCCIFSCRKSELKPTFVHMTCKDMFIKCTNCFCPMNLSFTLYSCICSYTRGKVSWSLPLCLWRVNMYVWTGASQSKVGMDRISGLYPVSDRTCQIQHLAWTNIWPDIRYQPYCWPDIWYTTGYWILYFALTGYPVSGL